MPHNRRRGDRTLIVALNAKELALLEDMRKATPCSMDMMVGVASEIQSAHQRIVTEGASVQVVGSYLQETKGPDAMPAPVLRLVKA